MAQLEQITQRAVVVAVEPQRLTLRQLELLLAAMVVAMELLQDVPDSLAANTVLLSKP